jgi:hypothetical protein
MLMNRFFILVIFMFLPGYIFAQADNRSLENTEENDSIYQAE